MTSLTQAQLLLTRLWSWTCTRFAASRFQAKTAHQPHLDSFGVALNTIMNPMIYQHMYIYTYIYNYIYIHNYIVNGGYKMLETNL
jgi:hypothetical protein